MRPILFFGSDSFSIQCFQAFRRGLINADHGGVDVIAVQGSEFAHSRDVMDVGNVYQVSRLESFTLPRAYSFGVVASFGHFIPPRLISAFEHCLNVHPSLLPQYRGPSPIQTAIREKESLSGVSIIDVHPTVMDGGDIYCQERVEIGADEEYGGLSARMADIGGRMLADVVVNIGDYVTVKRPQILLESHKRTKKIHKQDGLVSFKDMTSADIYALHRAISHQIPLHCTVGRHRVNLKGVRNPGNMSLPLNYDPHKWHTDTATLPPGTVFLERPTRSLWIRAREGWIASNHLHLSSSPIPLDGCQMMSALRAKSMMPLFP